MINSLNQKLIFGHKIALYKRNLLFDKDAVEGLEIKDMKKPMFKYLEESKELLIGKMTVKADDVYQIQQVFGG